MITLTNRLAAVAKLVRDGAYFADIGTDHGYLPVYLALSGRISRGIAADINEKPLASAKRTILKYELQHQIKTVLSDGLQKIDPQAEDIAVAGMGGELIARIVDGADWVRDPAKQLLLQPMTQAPFLRRYLAANGFSVLRELPVREGRRLYIILQAQYDGIVRVLSEAEALAGRCMKQTDELSQIYLRVTAEKQRKIAAGLTVAGRAAEAEQKAALAEELERCLQK